MCAHLHACRTPMTLCTFLSPLCALPVFRCELTSCGCGCFVHGFDGADASQRRGEEAQQAGRGDRGGTSAHDQCRCRAVALSLSLRSRCNFRGSALCCVFDAAAVSAGRHSDSTQRGVRREAGEGTVVAWTHERGKETRHKRATHTHTSTHTTQHNPRRRAKQRRRPSSLSPISPRR